MSKTSSQLIATIDFCQTNFISEYSIDKLLQGWGIKNATKQITPSFLNELISFLKALPLVYFGNSATNVGKFIEQLRKILLEKTPEAGTETVATPQGLNILKAKKHVIKYI